MKSRIYFLGLIVLCLVAIHNFAFAAENWEVIKTDHFEVFYKHGNIAKARECLVVLEATRLNVAKLTGVIMPRLRVVLEDIGSMSNASADPINPNIHIYTYPPNEPMDGVPGIASGENWWRMTGVHESTHINQMTQTSGVPKILTGIFGNYMSPNLITPDWLKEGLTVNNESQLSPYEGRLNDGFFDALLFAGTEGRRFPSLQEMTYTPFNFPSVATGGSYFYGGMFLQYLREKYGQEKLNEFYRKQGESFPAWLVGWLVPAAGIDYSARHAFGKSFKQLRLEWQNDYMKSRPAYVIDGMPKTKDKMAIYSDLVADENFIYFIKREYKKAGAYSAFKFERIIRKNLASGEEEELVSTTSSFTGRPQVYLNKLYYTVAELKRDYGNTTFSGFGYVSNLYCLDLATRHRRKLVQDEIRSFVASGPEVTVYTKDRKDKFGSEIWELNTRTDLKRLLHKSDLIISQLVATPDRFSQSGNGNYFIACARYDWENWGLYLINGANWECSELINTPYAETAPSVVNHYLLFVANYGKAYRVYSYDLIAKRLYQLTMGSYAHFPTMPYNSNQLYFVSMEAGGTNIFQKTVEYTEIPMPRYEPSVVPDIKTIGQGVNPFQGSYFDILKTMAPAVRYPVFNDGLGAVAAGYDVTNTHQYAARVKFGHDAYLVGQYENQTFAPLTLGFKSVTREEEQDYKLYGRYPIWKQLEPGITEISPSLAFKLDEPSIDQTADYDSRKQLSPGLRLVIDYPKWYWVSQADFALERRSWNSPRDRDSSELNALFVHYFGHPANNPEQGSEFLAYAHLFDDKDNPIPQKVEIRGFYGDDALTATRGGSLTLEYSFPVFQNRHGFWNPNVYWEDIAVAAFADAAFGEFVDPVYSGGLECRFEMALGFYLKFVPVVGMVFPSNHKSGIYIGAMISTQGYNNTRKRFGLE